MAVAPVEEEEVGQRVLGQDLEQDVVERGVELVQRLGAEVKVEAAGQVHGLRELVARCRALLRRSRQTPAPLVDTFSYANLCLFVNECRVTRDDSDLNLSPKEYKILELFIKNPKRVWSRDQLLEKVWGVDFVGDTKTVDVHIRWLREKIEVTPSAPELIQTVRGFGYRFG